MIHVMSVNDLQYKILEFVVCGNTIIDMVTILMVEVSTFYKGCKIFHKGGRRNRSVNDW